MTTGWEVARATSTSIICQEVLIQPLPGKLACCFSVLSLKLCRFDIQARLIFVNARSIVFAYFLTSETQQTYNL